MCSRHAETNAVSIGEMGGATKKTAIVFRHKLVPKTFGSFQPVHAFNTEEMDGDIFSVLDTDSLIALLLYVGPHARDIGAIWLASKHVRNQLSQEEFARQFATLYLGVPIRPLEEISWPEELKKWFKSRRLVAGPTLAIQGKEMRLLQEQEGKPVVSIERRGDGRVTVEHVMKMAQRSESLSDSLPNAPHDLQMMVLQPSSAEFPHLPLYKSHSMYYEVTLAKKMPKFGGAVIGFALPSLKTTLPGRTTYSFGVSLDKLIIFNGFSDLPERIPSPRGNSFKPKRGDTFGVGLVYSLSDCPPPCLTHIPESELSKSTFLSADTASFYVTFNGNIIYHKLHISCAYQVVPTIVLSTFGDALHVNFGSLDTPTSFFASRDACVKDLLAESDLDRLKFYKSAWKFNPYDVEKHLPGDAFTDIEEMPDKRPKTGPLSVPKSERAYYWQSLKDQKITVPVATDEMLWVDPSYHLFGVHHQSTLDFMQKQVDEKGYVPLIDMHSVAKCMEAANLQNLVANDMLSSERARTLMLEALISEDEAQTMLNHPEPLDVFLQWTESLVRYWERKLCWDLICFLKTDSKGTYTADHVPILFSWIVLDSLSFSHQTDDSPVYNVLETISNRWYDTRGLETCVVRMLKAVCQMFWTSRANHLNPGAVPPVRQAPNVSFLGIHWTTHLFMSFGLLDQSLQALPKNITVDSIRQQWDSWTDTQRSDILQATVCAFVGSHAMFHSPDSMSLLSPWLSPDPATAIHDTLTSIYQQRQTFRSSPECNDEKIWKQDMFDFLCGSISAVYQLRHPRGRQLTYPPNIELTGKYWYFSRYSDRFLTLTKFLRQSEGDYKPAIRQADTARQVQLYWNEKCAFATFWYGKDKVKALFEELLPIFPTNDLFLFERQDVDGHTSGIFSSGSSWATRLMTAAFITAGVAAFGLVAVQGARRWLRRK